MLIFWRRRRDSNPRYPFGVYTISNRARSTKLRDFSIAARLDYYTRQAPESQGFFILAKAEKRNHKRSGINGIKIPLISKRWTQGCGPVHQDCRESLTRARSADKMVMFPPADAARAHLIFPGKQHTLRAAVCQRSGVRIPHGPATVMGPRALSRVAELSCTFPRWMDLCMKAMTGAVEQVRPPQVRYCIKRPFIGAFLLFL